MKKIQWAFTVIMPISCFLLASFSFSAQVGFSLSYLKTYEFWRSYILMNALTLSTYFSAQYMRHSYNVTKKDYLDAEGNILRVVNKFSTWLSSYLHIHNRNRKKEIYRQSIILKIEKLQHKRDRVAEKGKKDQETLSVLAEYDAKIQSFKDMLSEEYIEKEIDFIAVKYHPVKRSQMIGTRWGDEKEDIADLVNPEKYYTTHGAKRIFTNFFITAIMASMVVDAVIAPDRSILIYFLTNIFSICMSVMSGIKIADRAYEKILLPNQAERIAILQSMQAWMEEKSKEEKPEAEEL